MRFNLLSLTFSDNHDMEMSDEWIFQEDGVFSGDTFSAVNISLGHSRQDYSICMWIALNYLRGSNSVFLSLGLAESVKALVGSEKDKRVMDEDSAPTHDMPF